MAWVLDTQTQEVVEVPEEAVAPGVATGRFTLQRGERVEVRTKEGQRGTIPAEEAQKAFGQLGYAYVPEGEVAAERRQAEYEDRGLEAAAAGVARGATLGLSDVALTSTGVVEDETLRGLEEFNEYASAGGEVVGVAAPAIFSGGAYAPAGIASRVATRAAAKLTTNAVGRTALAGAIEGGFFGAGQAVSEDALGQAPLTAQKLVADVGTNALLGLGGGAAFGALERKIAGAAAREGVEVAAGQVDDAARAVAGQADAAVPAPQAPTVPFDDAAEETIQLYPGQVGTKTRVDRAPAPSAAAPPAPVASLDDAVGAFDAALGDGGEAGAAFRKTLEGAAEKHGGRVQRFLEGLGLKWPTATEWVQRDLDLTASMANKLKDSAFGNLEQIAPRALLQDPRYAAARTLDEKLELIRTKQAEAGGRIGAAVRSFDELAGLDWAVDWRQVAGRVREEVLAPLEKNGSFLDRPILKRLRGFVDDMEQRTGTTFQEAEAFKRSLDPHLRWDSNTEAPLRDALRQARGILNAEIDAGAKAVAARAGRQARYTDWKRAKALYAAMTELEPMVAQRAAARSSGNRFFSLTDNMAGLAAVGAGGLNPMGLLAGGAAAVVNKWGRERLPQILALQMARYESSASTRAAAKAVRRAVEQADSAAVAGERGAPVGTQGGGVTATAGAASASTTSGTAATSLSPYVEILRQAMGEGERELWAMHTALSVDPAYRAAMEAHGLSYQPEAEEGGRRRASAFRIIEARLNRFESEAGKDLDGVLSGRPRAMPARLSPSEAVAQGRRLIEVSAQPGVMIERLSRETAALGAAAPATTVEVMALAQRVATFLADKAPKGPTPLLEVKALARPSRPADAEAARYARYASAAFNPRGVLSEAAAGMASPEGVETLQALYPQLLEEWRQQLMERLSSHGTALSYRQRLGLSYLLGSPLDPSLKPESVAMLQGAYAQKEPQQPSRRQAPSARTAFVDAATETERITARRLL